MTRSEGMQLRDPRAREAFFERIVEPTPGWLDPYAARRTLDLLEYQEDNSIRGSLCEIGIFCGRYFSLLLRSAAARGDRIVALDTFSYISRADFGAALSARLGEDASLSRAFAEAVVVEGRSGDVTGRRLLEELGCEARFISIDGSHEYDDVLWDLAIADAALSAGGVIAADDFLHPISLGVTAALFRYLDAHATLVPFAHVSNKLFLSRPAWADRYRGVLEAAILADAADVGSADVKSSEYRSHIENGARVNVEAAFRGYRILTVRL